VRFLADMGVDLRVVAWLRDQGHDAIHLRERGMHRAPDAEIFRRAVIVVVEDTRHRIRYLPIGEAEA